MTEEWNVAKLQNLIRDEIQESLTLEYKAADALAKTDSKRNEITKDVSALANSSGGIVIYGIKEFDQKDKKHLPEKLSPIDQSLFSREWLEQIINNIRPRINGLVIHPVALNSGPNHVAYIVEIPKSMTAHQAADKRYYKRFNFLSVPMEDHEIRDVMNRAITPNANVEIRLFRGMQGEPDYKSYRGLKVIVRNESTKVINRYKVTLKLANVGWCDDDAETHLGLVEHVGLEEDKALKWTMHGKVDGRVDVEITYQPVDVLFPKEEVDIGPKIDLAYPDPDIVIYDENDRLWRQTAEENNWIIEWTLYADSMSFKREAIRVCDLLLIE